MRNSLFHFLLTCFFSLLIVSASNAQTSRIQVIHNAAGLAFDTVDVYINNIKLNNLRFRHSTPRLSYAAGTYKININHKSSTDSGNQVLLSRTITINSGDRIIVMLQGVENPANYASNPLGKSTAFSMNIAKQSNAPTTNVVNYTFLNGITDSRKVNAFPRNLPQVFEGIEYTVYNNSFVSLNTTIRNEFTTSPKIFDLTNEGENVVYNTKQFPIANNNFVRNNIVFVASGFINPAANNNGPKAELFAVDSAGGPFIAGVAPIKTGVQIVHNSPDVLLDTIDIYVNHVKYDNVGFRSALPLLNLQPGNYQINFNHKNSVDSSDGVQYRYSLTLDLGMTYTLFLKGVLQPALYRPNPAGISTALSIHKVSADYQNAVANTFTQYILVNGNTDANYNEFYVDNVNYFPVDYGSINKLSGAVLSNRITSTLKVLDGSNNIINPQPLDASSRRSKLNFVFTSGFVQSNSSNQNGKKISMFVFDSTGNVQEVITPILPALVQFVHNAADTLLDTIDVYFKGVKIDNIAFREATGNLVVDDGSYIVNINHKNSTDSSDRVIARVPVSIFAYGLSGLNKGVLILNGVVNPNLYYKNPGSTNNTSLSILPVGMMRNASNGIVRGILLHGVTDMDNIQLKTPPIIIGIQESDLPYFTTNLWAVNANETYLEMNQLTFPLQSKGYIVPFQQYSGKSVLVFLSGFRDPSLNRNGKSMGLFIVDSLGGPAKLVSEGFRAQFIHASADSNLQSVDVWNGNTRILTQFKTHKATNTFTLALKDSAWTITKSGSKNSKENVLFVDSLWRFSSGSNTYAILSGWLDTTALPKNPSGLNTRFKLNYFPMDNVPLTNGTKLTLFNAIPDADSVSIIIKPTNQTLIQKTPYNNYTKVAFNYGSNTSIYELREHINSSLNRTFRFRLNSLYFEKCGLLFSSPSVSSLEASYYIALTTGEVYELPQLTSNLQFVHASADTAVKNIDVFVNGVKLVNNLNYQSASRQLKFGSYKPLNIKLTYGGSVSDSVALITTNLTPDSSTTYCQVLNGLLNPSMYAKNPEGINTALNLATFGPMRLRATSSPNNVDVLFFNAATDAPKVNTQPTGQSVFLSNQTSYKSFYNYSPQSPISKVVYNVKESSSNNLLHVAEANLIAQKGNAGIAVLTGFKNPSNNNNGQSLRLFMVWPNGNVDTLKTVTTGLNNIAEESTAANFKLYPNPAVAYTVVHLYSNITGNGNVQVFDVTGKCLINKQCEFIQGSNQFVIDTDELQAGVYYCYMNNGEQSYSTKLMIIK